MIYNIITNDLDEFSQERMIQHLDKELDAPPAKEEQIPEACQQILIEINEGHIMTSTHLNNIFLLGKYIPIMIEKLKDIPYELENEYEMVESCLEHISKFSQGDDFAQFLNSRIIPYCKKPETIKLISEECIRHTDNNNYSILFSSCIDRNPSKDMWPFILRMEKYAESAMNLLFNKVFPDKKKDVIDKIRANPSIEDMTILSLLQLTEDEFNQERIDLLALNYLRSAILGQGQEDEAKMKSALTYIGNKMKELDKVFPDFIDIAIQLINEGDLYQIQESVKFLFNILHLLSSESILNIIESGALQKICELIDSESTSSTIESSLSLILVCLEKYQEKSIENIDFSILIKWQEDNSEEEIRPDFNHLVDKILSFCPK